MQAMKGRGRKYFRGNARGSSQPQQQETTPFGQYFDPTRSAQYGATGEAKCGKCGNNRHSNVLYCLANNQQCLHCGRVGHFKRCYKLDLSD